MHRHWSALALTVLALALPSAAAAAPSWLPAQQLSDPSMDALQSATAMAPDGTVIAAWVELPFSGGLAPGRGLVQDDLVARVRPPGGTFGPEQTVTSGHLADPQLAIDSSGRAVLAWLDGTTVSTAVRAPGGSFGDILSYSGEATAVDSLQLALDSAGNASLLWRTGVGHPANQVRAGYRPAAGALAPAQTVDSSNPPSGGSDRIQEMTVAGNVAGDDVALWRHDVSDAGGTTESFWTARRTGSGAYGTPIQLQSVSGSGDGLTSGTAAMAPNGDTLLAWERGFSTTSLEAKFWPSGGTPGTVENPASADGAGTNPGNPVAAFDSSGSGLVGWRAKVGSTFGLQYANRLPGGTYGPAATLDSAASGLLFAHGPGGGLIATWSSDDNTPRAALRSAGAGAFGASHDLAPAGAANVNDGPLTGADSVGDAVAGWSQFDGAGQRHLFAAGYDGAPPMLAGPTLATQPVVAGLPVGLSATASDVWSTLSTGWDFGDGATAAGANVTHAYARAGDYTARVTATDAVGNASSATLPVHVIQFLGSFGISRHTFAVGPQSTPVSAVRRGTTFRLALGAPATVNIKIARKTRGIRIGKRCRTLTRRNRHRKHAKHCTLYVAVKPKSTLTRPGKAGANSYPFSGRIGRRALKPGSYRATGTATGADGVVSRRLVVNFKIVAAGPGRHRHG